MDGGHPLGPWVLTYLLSIKDINTNCLKQFTAHWECLENNNHYLFECRRAEQQLNNCVFEKLVRLLRYIHDPSRSHPLC